MKKSTIIGLTILVALILVIVVSLVYFFSQRKSHIENGTTQTRNINISIYSQGDSFIPFVEGFKEGLTEYITPKDNVNLLFKEINVEGELQESIDVSVLNQITSDKPDLIVAIGPQIMQATMTASISRNLDIPTLYGFGGNPNDGFFVRSMQSSGNSFTGITWRSYALDGKRLEMLKRIAPNIRNVLVYTKRGSLELAAGTDFVNESAQFAGINITIRDVDTTDEFVADLAQFDSKKYDAISYLSDPFFAKNAEILRNVIFAKNIPVVFDEPSAVYSGALASYGTDYKNSGKQLSRLAKKIINGVKPTDIPSEVVSTYALYLNENTAKKMGIVFSNDISRIADVLIPIESDGGQ